MHTNDRCFCDLAPFYALDLLDEADRVWVEQQIVACPDLALELSEFQAAVTTIPYTTPPSPLAADLKSRLFERIAQPLPSLPVEVLPSSTAANFTSVRQSQLEWRPYRIPGVMVARLHVDSERREVVALFKAEAGVRYPVHHHANVEEIYMLAGDLVIDHNVYGAGDYIRSEHGSLHAPETRNGCMFLVRTSLDDEYPD